MNIGLVAHDAKKILMLNFAIAFRGYICNGNDRAVDRGGNKSVGA